MTDDKKRGITLQGKILSPGLGKGDIFIYRDILTRFDEFYDIDHGQVEGELKGLDRALERISEDLSSLAGRVKDEMASELSGVFNAHLAMIQDDSLKDEVRKEIKNELVSAGTAVRTVFRRWERRFRSMEADVAKQKGDDMRDLARRLVSALAGVHAHALANLPGGSVLVANRLLPSDTVFLKRNAASAAVLEIGGKGSHAALFAREMGIPCIAGISGLLDKAPEQGFAIVDATDGEVIFDPTPKQKERFHVKEEKRRADASRASSRSKEPAVTGDGNRIAVMANVGDAEDTQVAVDRGADGVGLYRLEQVYLGRQEPPTQSEILKEMQQTLRPAKGLPVTVRLLDVGADKPLPFLDLKRESNPALGLRGVRFLMAYPDLLHAQLDALLELSSEHELRILVPMVALANDMKEVRKALEDARSRSGHAEDVQLGAMIETPAAALAAGEIAGYSDFLSFGTNDLTQYSFAVDRENASVDEYFDDANEVIFRLIRIAHEDAPDIPLSVCGELAGRIKATSKLIDCGITSLSVVPPAIPEVKEAVRDCGATS